MAVMPSINPKMYPIKRLTIPTIIPARPNTFIGFFSCCGCAGGYTGYCEAGACGGCGGTYGRPSPCGGCTGAAADSPFKRRLFASVFYPRSAHITKLIKISQFGPAIRTKHTLSSFLYNLLFLFLYNWKPLNNQETAAIFLQRNLAFAENLNRSLLGIYSNRRDDQDDDRRHNNPYDQPADRQFIQPVFSSMHNAYARTCDPGDGE